MILKRIRVQNLGPFHELVEFPAHESFSDRFTVIHGPNEAGKTTLFNALHHALFTPYRSSGQEIDALRPWGTGVSPLVEVEFIWKGRNYKLRKSWLNQPLCVLSEERDGRYHDVQDGDGADETVRRWLLGQRPGRGAAKDEHRGLARLFWIPQGAVAVPELGGEVRSRVEAALGVATLDPGESRLVQEIAAAYQEWWTATGKPRASTGRLQAERELESSRAARQDLVRQVQALEELGLDLKGTLEDESDLVAQQDELRGAIAGLEKEAKRIQALKAQVDKARTEFELRETEFKAADDKRLRLRQAKDDRNKAMEDLERVAIRLERLGTDLQASRDVQTELEGRLREAERATKQAEEEWNRARQLSEAINLSQAVTKLETRLAKARQLLEELAARKEHLAALPKPSAKDVSMARTIEQGIAKLEGQLEAVGLTLALTFDQARTGVFIADDGSETPVAATASETVRLRAARRAKLVVKGLGVIEVESGAAEVAQLENKLVQAKEALAGFLGRFSANSVADLEEMRAAGEAASAAVKEVEAELDKVLGDEGEVETLSEAVADRRRQIASLCERMSIVRETLDHAEMPDVSALERKVKQGRDTEDGLRKQLVEVGKRLEALKAAQSQALQEQAKFEASRKAADDTIDRLVAAAGSGAAIEEAYHAARRERDAAQERFKELEAQLPSKDQDAEIQRQKLEDEAQQVEMELRSVREKAAGLRARIEQLGEGGPYEQLAQVEEKLERLQGEYRRNSVEARAIRLLYRLTEERRQRMVGELTADVSRRVSSYLERVSGKVGRQIIFDERLIPSSFSVPDAPGLSLEVLSMGAREQVFVLTRLALACSLAKEYGRMLFVLDDALVNTDQTRHRRLVELLQEAADELQIMVLTCHPDRYRLAGAQHVQVGA